MMIQFFVIYDVILPAMLDFTVFIKRQEITDIDTKSGENAYEM